MKNAVFLDLETLHPQDLDLDPLLKLPLSWQMHQNTQPRQLAERLREAQLVVTNKVVIDRKTLQQNRQLKAIAIAATGTNNVDLECAAELGIPVSNVSGYSTPAVVQHTFALLLALVTRLPMYQQAVTAGAWQRSAQFCLLDYPIRELAGMTLGIVGYGALGQGVAEIARAFGMDVMIAQRPGGEPRPGRQPLDQLLETVDVLSLHCPLTSATRGLIGADELKRMKADALLLNTARGGLIDEAALAEALRQGEIGGAGIDVLEQEPPSSDSPLLCPDIPNLIITPHSAWGSRQARQRLVGELALNIQGLLQGRPRNRVV